jgi:hypothetical protein
VLASPDDQAVYAACVTKQPRYISSGVEFAPHFRKHAPDGDMPAHPNFNGT